MGTLTDTATAVWPEAFRDQMKRLMGLKFAPADLSTHWGALADLSHAELDAAVSRAQRECDEFPSPRLLRTFVDEYRSRPEIAEEDDSRAAAIPPRTIEMPDGSRLTFTREWKCYCDQCGDTGVRAFWCGDRPSAQQPWIPVARCERRRHHGAHEWVEACPCADSNPDVQRRRARAQQVVRKQANG